MIFLTGGTGLVGSHILLKLVENGQKVNALKRKTSSLKVVETVFSRYDKAHLLQSINWINGDLMDIFSLEEGMKDCQQVIHCAAIVSFNPKDYERMMQQNAVGTANIVNVCLSQNIEKLGYISSIATLGGHDEQKIKTENDYWREENSNTQYALSKYLAEQEVWRGVEENLNAVIVNPSVILGPGDWTKGSSKLFEKVWEGLKFYTNGGTGYVDVLDVADCMLKLMASDTVNERFILNADNVKYKWLFSEIAQHLNRPKPYIKVNPFLKEIAWRIEWLKSTLSNKSPLLTKETAHTAMKTKQFSNQKIVNKLNYTFIPVSESIKRYSQWFLNEKTNS